MCFTSNKQTKKVVYGRLARCIQSLCCHLKTTYQRRSVVTHLQLSWCREALGQIVPHASDELVAPPSANQLPPVAAGPAPTSPSSLCFTIYTSAGSESRRAGVGVKGSEHSGRLPASLPSASQVGQVITASAALCSR